MRKTIFCIAICLFLIISASIFFADFVYINHRIFTLDTQSVDLSGKPVSGLRRLARLPELEFADLRGTGLSVEDYTFLKESLPNCQILWDLPFQGQTYSLDTRNIRISHLTEEEVLTLDYLENLATVDAMDCRDYPALSALQRRRPGCLVAYQVPIGNTVWDCQETALDVPFSALPELAERLSCLSRVNRVHFSGPLPAAVDLVSVLEAHSGIVFSCNIQNQRVVLGLNTRRLDLSGVPLTLETAQTLLACFPNLEEAELLECGLTDPELYSLARQFPDASLIWDVPVAGRFFRTDSTSLDFSNNPPEDIAQIESKLSFFPNLEKVILGDCGIPSSQLALLDERHPDIRFVWTVHLGSLTLRTDATFFAPVVYGAHVVTEDLEDLRYCTDMIAVDIGHMDVTDCSWAAYMPNLQYLIIADTPISDISPLENHKNLVFLEMFLTMVRDYSPLVSCTALEDLNLCFTYGPSDDIRQMTWLKRLWWDGNWSAIQGLAEALPDTETNFHSGSSTGGTWRAGQHYKEQRDIIGMPYFYG